MSASYFPSATMKRLRDSSIHDRTDVGVRSPLENPIHTSRLAHAGDGSDELGSSRVEQDCSSPSRHDRSQSLYHDEDAARRQISLTKKQQRFLRLWHEDFAQPDSTAALVKECSTALATAIQTQPDLVVDYIERRCKGSEDDDEAMINLQSDSDPEIEPYLLSKANNHLSPPTLALVEKYISACRRRRSPTDGRRSVNTGPFRCTFGCGYRTKRVFDWRRHEETHEPQELWLCAICSRSDVHNPFLVNRKDKFLKHAADKHTHVRAEEVLHKSKLAFVPRGELGCPYCGEDGASWDERCRHVLGHFEDEVERGMKRVKVVHEDGDEEQEISVAESGSVAASATSSRDEGDAAS